jgi:Ser/Thr protein kinase RdoA (MazF antagonist)
MTPDHPDYQTVCDAALAFDACQGITALTALAHGLINRSYRVIGRDRSFLLQQINTRIFPHPEQIMANWLRLKAACDDAGASDQPPRIPQFFPTRNGDWLLTDQSGAKWRLAEWIDHGTGITELSMAQAYAVGQALGHFHAFTARLSVTDFIPILPQLHDSQQIWQQLCHVWHASSDQSLDAQALFTQLSGAAVWIEEFYQHAHIWPQRVVHGDPKRDNVLFDLELQNVLCLIDFDTVQPGLIEQDIADCLRSCCVFSGNDGTIGFDHNRCRALLQGYRHHGAPLLMATTAEGLVCAIRVLPLELGMRFLTDHLQGDVYFHVSYRGQNLQRAQRQLTLAYTIHHQRQAIQTVISDCFASERHHNN